MRKVTSTLPATPATAAQRVVAEQRSVAVLQRLVERAARRDEITSCLVLFRRDGRALREQSLFQRLLGRIRRMAAVQMPQRLAVGAVEQLEAAVDAEADNARGEHTVVHAHLADEAHAGGRHALRRVEQRNDGAAARIAAEQQTR